MEPITLYSTLLLCGFVLIGMEIFIPGGILGIFGAAAWIAAAIVGWQQFSDPWNMVSSFSLLFAGIITFVVWIKYFPKSRIGKSLSLGDSSATCKSHKASDLEIGAAGEALSTLRPSGIARINGKRYDVVADGDWIEAGDAVKVIKTSGGFVTVVKA